MKKLNSFILFFVSTLIFGQTPGLQWADGFGGPNSVAMSSRIKVDAANNIYVSGTFSSTVDFDPGPGTFCVTPSGGGLNNLFLLKLSPAGNLIWVRTLDGVQPSVGKENDLTIDASGKLILMGVFSGTVDFDPGAGVQNQVSSGGSADVFILKLDTAGNFVWVKTISNPVMEYGTAIAADASNNVYCSGVYYGTVDIDPGASTYTLPSTAGFPTNMFLLKLDTNGNFVYGKAFTGPGEETPYEMLIDGPGNIILTGRFTQAVDWDPGPGTYTIAPADDPGYLDAFVCKLDPSGNFTWVKHYGGVSPEFAICNTIDEVGNIYISGYFFEFIDFDSGPGLDTVNAGASGVANSYILKIRPSGLKSWARVFKGSGPNKLCCATYKSGSLYVSGLFKGTSDFDLGPGTNTISSAGDADGCLFKLDTTGTLLWYETINSIETEVITSVTCDNQNNIYTTGYFGGAVDFDPSAGVFTLNLVGASDLFVQKLSNNTAGIKETTKLVNQIVAFPNPGTGIYSFSGIETVDRIDVFDANGRKVLSKVPKGYNQIDISGYPAGIYVVTVYSGSEVYSGKIIQY